MITSQLKLGDRVRVVLEGEVTFMGEGTWTIANRNGFVYNDSPHVVSVERLPDPEPEWQPGDVVLDADGVLYQRRAPRPGDDARWVWNIGGMHGHGVIETAATRPLTHLVRNGKPVQS